MVAIDDSASMLCARVMRGISSIEKAVDAACASARIASGAPSGSAKPMTVWPDRSSASVGRNRPHLQNDVGGGEHVGSRAATVRAGLLVGGVGKSGRRPGVLLDDDVEARFSSEPRRRRRNQRDPGLARPRFTRNADSHGATV